MTPLRSRALVAVLAVLLAVPAVAQAQVLPPLPPPLPGGGGSGTGGDGGTGGGPSTPAPSTPPTGGTLVPGEDLDGAVVVADPTAHGGTHGRASRASSPAGVAPGTYLLTARVRAPAAARVDLLTAGEMAGSYGVGTGWRLVTALVTLTSSSQTIGAGTWSRGGDAQLVDVDWLHLAERPAAMTVRGNHVVTPGGGDFIPRGFNKAGYQGAGRIGDRISVPKHEAESMAAWGATMVRIGLNQEYWLADCPSTDGNVQTTYRTAVRREVEGLTSRGVLVVLALVGTERGQHTGCNVTDGILREMADERSLSFWGSVANTFKSNHRVAFDLFNEPHRISDDVWRNGGTVTYGSTILGQSKQYRAIGMQALYNRVRSTGATNLVFVSGNRWASDPRTHLSHPIDGYGIVAASHSYCHDCPSGNPRPSPNLDTHNSEELRARHPLTVTETGWHHHWASGFNRAMIDWAEARSVGWLMYAWTQPKANDVPDTYALLASGKETFEVGDLMIRPPSRAGAPVWNSLAHWRVARGYPVLARPE